MTAGRAPIAADQLTVVPADKASGDDLDAVFGIADHACRCRCQRLEVAGWVWRDTTSAEALVQVFYQERGTAVVRERVPRDETTAPSSPSGSKQPRICAHGRAGAGARPRA